MSKNNLKNAFPDTPINFKNKVRATLNHLPIQEENGEMEKKSIHKKGYFKKRLIIAVAATMTLGTTVFAAGKIFTIVGSSSNIPTYTDIPIVEQLQSDFGYNPKIVKQFNNGYEFANGYTVNNEGLDEEGHSVKKAKSLRIDYKKGNDTISIYTENTVWGEKDDKEVVVDTYKDIDMYYLSYANKIVPEDYEMTEEDKQDEASGKYVFSVGSKEVEVSQNQHLSWEQDGVYYSLLVIDSQLTQDELIEMAHQVIDAK